MNKYIKHTLALALAVSFAVSVWAKLPQVEPSYAWKVIPPLGLREPSTIDTLYRNYAQQFVPSLGSSAWATTGNYGAEGINMIFMERGPRHDFFFRDALDRWLPSVGKHTFYNTRIPMTLVSYNTGGGTETSQDRLDLVFSGNINRKAQIGANFDYLYSKGSYNYQADKDLTWGFNGSYIGDQYEMQAFYNHYNFLNKENGGITDDRYVTNPAEIQGGSSNFNTKSIPTRLSNAHTRYKGGELFLNNRYKVGKWREIFEEGDSVPYHEFVPVASAIWTLQYHEGKHKFLDTNSSEIDRFFEHTYINNKVTDDFTRFWSLTNTVGLDMLEGFSKLAKFGLSAYGQHQVIKYIQTPDTFIVDRNNPEMMQGYTPLPEGVDQIAPKHSQQRFWVGGQLTKQQGALLTFIIGAKIGLIGDVAADLGINGTIGTKFPFLGDSVSIIAQGSFSNTAPSYLFKSYISNHFCWSNPDFGKERKVRLGGTLKLDRTHTMLTVMVENLQNYIYFGEDCMPVQNGGNVQVFSAQLQQNFHAGVLHFDNKLTYQTTSSDKVIPLPKFAIYSNLYLNFKIAKVFDVQLGVDCDYYTSYYGVGYQPALMSFYNQREMKVGNFPFMNAYANMKLGKARFYVMMSHVNQGLFGKPNYFSIPHYPLNPRRFQLGVSVDFTN